jgi:hypothetical protein
MLNIGKNTRGKKSKTNLPIIGLTCLLVIIILYLLLHIQPNRRYLSYCARVQIDAQTIAATILDYLADPENTDVEPSDIEELINTENSWTFTAYGDEFVIQVTDNSGQCPNRYQKRFDEWNSGTYTLRISNLYYQD